MDFCLVEGDSHAFKCAVYQCYAAQIFNENDAASAIEIVQMKVPKGGILSYAWILDNNEMEDLEEVKPESITEIKYSYDPDDTGVGDKLIYLLERSLIRNCVLILVRSPTKNKPPCYLGTGRFRIAILCAKQVLNIYKIKIEHLKKMRKLEEEAKKAAEEKALEDKKNVWKGFKSFAHDKVDTKKPFSDKYTVLPTSQICAKSVTWPKNHRAVRGVINLGRKKCRPCHFLDGRVLEQEMTGEAKVFSVLNQPNHLLPRPKNPIYPPRLSRADIVELCSMKTPPFGVRVALHLVSVLLEEIDSSWQSCLKMMMSMERWHKALSCIDILSISPEAIETIRIQLQQDALMPNVVQRESLTAICIVDWLSEIICKYDELKKLSEAPKKSKLKTSLLYAMKRRKRRQKPRLRKSSYGDFVKQLMAPEKCPRQLIEVAKPSIGEGLPIPPRMSQHALFFDEFNEEEFEKKIQK